MIKYTEDAPILSEDPVLCQREVVTQALRKRICAGVWSVGERIPPHEALANDFGVSVATLQKALIPLAEEGLLKRSRRLGTFVAATTPGPRAEKPAKPRVIKGCTGVFLQTSHDALNGVGMFLQHLVRHLQHELVNSEKPHRFWNMPYLPQNPLQPVAELLAAIRSREVARLIVPIMPFETAQAIQDLTIPVVGCDSHLPESGMVDFDLRFFVEQGLQHLASRGHRRIGVISILTKPPALPDGGREYIPVSTQPRFNAGFERAAERFGVEFRPEWMMFPQKGLLPFDQAPCRSGDLSHSEYGFQAFMRMWNQPERPDGLLVFSDQVAQGAAMAILRENIAVPDSLGVVFHKNSDIDLFTPIPATYLEANIAQMATTMLRLADGEMHGPVYLPHQLKIYPGHPNG